MANTTKTEDGLKKILLDEINAYEGWMTKGQLFLISEQNGYSPENGGRRLRELVNENKIEVSYYKGKRNQKLARYARLGETTPIPPKPKISIINVNGMPTAVYEN